MKFYTGRGDDGTSTILGLNKRIPKGDKHFGALGAVDELNSYLGICRSLAKSKDIQSALLKAQEDLFIIQAELGRRPKAGRPTPYGRRTSIVLKPNNIKQLEKTIDKFGKAIGVLTKFTIPGGSPLSAHLDYARAVCRRAERKCLDVGRPTSQNWPVFAYLNRLSSLLFVLARYANKKAGIREKNPNYK